MSGSAHPGAEAETVRCQPFTASSAFYAQSIKVVNTVYPLVIDVKALPTQQLPDAAVAKTPALQCQFSDAP